MIDMTNEFGVRVANRLQKEQIIWLVTSDATQTPQPSPVWFHWDGDSFLIYSKPNAPKMRNIANNGHVALHLNTDQHGDDVVILLGEAQAIDDVPAERVRAYFDKYDQGIKGLEMTPETFAQTYSAALRVTPRKVRGY